MSYKLACEKIASRFKHDAETGQLVRVRKIKARGTPYRRIMFTVPIIETVEFINKNGRVHSRKRTKVGERSYHATKGWRVDNYSKAQYVKL